MKNLIVAYDRKHGIGYKGQIPWQGELPGDMRHFKEVTMGSAVIMGRLTFQSIGMSLPGRENIVVSSTVDELDGCKIARDLDEAYSLVAEGQDSFIIGGESLYREGMPGADRIYATEIDTTVKADRFFPPIDAERWREISREEHQKDERNHYDYRFIIYESLR